MILLITEVNVPSGYEYITGTVNGADTSFVADTIIEGLCLCSCEESTTYACVLNFYDADNTIISTVTKTITQETNKFVFDRTQEDVDIAKRLKASGRALTIEDLKGCLNLSDLERAEVNFEALAILDDETMDIESIPEFPSVLFFESLLDNAEIVKESGYQLDNSPDIPTMPLNDYVKWNALERILWDNFDIRTTRFKYFGMPIRENTRSYPFIFLYQGVVYVGTMSAYINYPLAILNGSTITEALINIQNMLGYEYVETTNIRTVDGSNTIRTVDGTNIIRKVDN